MERIIRNKHFWIISGIFILVTLLHYVEQFGMPGTIAPSLHFGLTRHALERILFLVPIVYAGFVFGKNAGFISCGIALIIMLPRAAVVSPVTWDALLEILATIIVGLGATVAIMIHSDRAEKTRKAMAELESAHGLLQRYVRSARDNERRLTILNTISNVLTESLEVSTILNKAMHLIMELMDVEVVMIFSLKEDTGELTLVAYEGITEEFARFMEERKIGEVLYSKAVADCQPLTIESKLIAVDAPEFRKMRIESQLVVPLIVRDRVSGALCVAMRRPRKFLPGEVELLSSVATQIASAIENARLYEKQRLTAERLSISERNYRQLFENASDAIWLHDLTGNIIIANKAAATLTGYSEQELAHMNVKEFMSDTGLNLAAKMRSDLLEMKRVSMYEQHMTRKDGSEAIVMLNSSLVKEEGEAAAYLHIARDVTEELKMRENLVYYLGQITRAQEEERKRIARELHDDTSQILYALTRQVDNFLRSNNQLPAEHAEFLSQIRYQLKEALEGVRRFSQALRPPMIDDLGLVPAVHWLVSDMQTFMDTEIVLKVTGDERRLSSEAELTLFRATQEALRNVWKHSQATRAEVAIDMQENKVKISITDNGKGFELSQIKDDLPRLGKLGLTGIEERVRLLNGTLTVNSESGKGTTIIVEAPL